MTHAILSARHIRRLALKPVTTAISEPDQRVAIWSLSPQTIGAYFAIFLIQYIPGIAFEAYTRIQQQATDGGFAHTALEIVRASGPIGIGSAMNAIAIAVFVEAVMVLARILSEQQRQQGIEQGIKIGIKEERKQSNAKLRAWAKEKGIPLEELPIVDEDE